MQEQDDDDDNTQQTEMVFSQPFMIEKEKKFNAKAIKSMFKNVCCLNDYGAEKATNVMSKISKEWNIYEPENIWNLSKKRMEKLIKKKMGLKGEKGKLIIKSLRLKEIKENELIFENK